jgi:SAF domain
MSTLSQPLGQVLTPKKSNLVPALLLILGLIIALSAATYGYIESRRTEKVIIAVRSVPYGQQITTDDLGTIELPLHRPAQLAGIADPNGVIGQWAAREIGPNDLMQANMLMATAPDQPVYPSGQQLDKDTVPVPFSTQTIGPLTHRDVVNVGYNSTTGDPHMCIASGGAVSKSAPVVAPAATGDAGTIAGYPQGRPFACRLLQRVKVLYVDEAKNVAYLQMTPYQAHTIWALQAANVQLWGERYGSSSDELPALDRLDAAQVDLHRLTMNLTDTLKLYQPEGFAGAIPGSGSAIPGQQVIPGSTQPTATPQVTP